MAFITGLQDALGDLIMNLAMLAVLVLAIPLVPAGEIQGVYLAFLALVSSAASRPCSPSESPSSSSDAPSAGERLFEIVDAEPEVKDTRQTFLHPRRLIPYEFDRVGFRYKRRPASFSKDVSFTLEPGRRVAVVGPSGAGKSTLAASSCASGTLRRAVSLGGCDIRGYAQDDLRPRVRRRLPRHPRLQRHPARQPADRQTGGDGRRTRHRPRRGPNSTNSCSACREAWMATR